VVLRISSVSDFREDRDHALYHFCRTGVGSVRLSWRICRGSRSLSHPSDPARLTRRRLRRSRCPVRSPHTRCRASPLLWRLRCSNWLELFAHRAASLRRQSRLGARLRVGWLLRLLRRCAQLLLAGCTGFRPPWRLGQGRRTGLRFTLSARRRQTSTLAASALSWMNCRRGSTRSPISWSNSTLASSTSLMRTCSSERALVSSVVSHNCSGFISPRPL